MTDAFQSLVRVLREALQSPPPDLVTALDALPPVGELPSPWDSWALFGLVRHRQRHLWLANIITTRLNANLLDIARLGALGHPAVPQSGPVPGLPEWEYYFHGKGCCLTHRVTGEEIDVDFFDDSAEYVDRVLKWGHARAEKRATSAGHGNREEEPVLGLTANSGQVGGPRQSAKVASFETAADMLITSNLAFGDWGQVFQGERMTAALLDRLTHRCHIFEMNGESYRFRESMKAKKDKDSKKSK